MNDDDRAMKAVLDSMGQVARAAKAKKYQRQPPPEAEQPAPDAEAQADEPQVQAHELEALLNGG